MLAPRARGFDVKIFNEIIKLRKEDKNERDERESLLDLYMRAMETAPPEQAKAA
ncbi:GapR family DNA-binding domain-containing protein [Bradyrhizobium sp. PUT101]|uniref:GapR family DNA-binding domain-containing protein n=1 Tax=Bradyrhizobium sp. PUT101 TaxID=3447427 RepID=UPI003F871905